MNIHEFQRQAERMGYTVKHEEYNETLTVTRSHFLGIVSRKEKGKDEIEKVAILIHTLEEKMVPLTINDASYASLFMKYHAKLRDEYSRMPKEKKKWIHVLDGKNLITLVKDLLKKNLMGNGNLNVPNVELQKINWKKWKPLMIEVLVAITAISVTTALTFLMFLMPK